jgi:hypothetical protein
MNENILSLACDTEFQAEVIKSNKAFLYEKEKVVFGVIFDIKPVVAAGKEKPKLDASAALQESKHPIVQALLDEFEAESIV